MTSMKPNNKTVKIVYCFRFHRLRLMSFLISDRSSYYVLIDINLFKIKFNNYYKFIYS